jgi:hypothetical protein
MPEVLFGLAVLEEDALHRLEDGRREIDRLLLRALRI